MNPENYQYIGFAIIALQLLVYFNRKKLKSYFFERKTHPKINHVFHTDEVKQIARHLAIQCQNTKSNMVLLMHDNQCIETYSVIVGNDFDTIKLLCDASDKNKQVDEILQILAKHYNAKFEM